MLTPLDAPFTQNTGVSPQDRLSYLAFDFPLSIEDPGLVGIVSLLNPALHGSRPAILPS